MSVDSALVGVFTGGEQKIQTEKEKYPELDTNGMTPANWLTSSCFAHNYSNVFKMFVAKCDTALKDVENCTGKEVAAVLDAIKAANKVR